MTEKDFELEMRDVEGNCTHWFNELSGLFFNRIVDNDKLNEALYEFKKAVGLRNCYRAEFDEKHGIVRPNNY